MAVARRAVDRHAGVHQVLAGGIDIVDAIGEMAEIAPAGIGLRRAAVRGRPVPGQFDLGDPFLSRRGEEDQREAARLIVEAANLVQPDQRSEEHTSELQSLMRISYAVFCLKKKNDKPK